MGKRNDGRMKTILTAPVQSIYIPLMWRYTAVGRKPAMIIVQGEEVALFGV